MPKKRSILDRAVAKARIRLDRRPVAHFLHIGKTGGTAVKSALHGPQDDAVPGRVAEARGILRP